MAAKIVMHTFLIFLKVGTLDQLVGLSDDLGKLDTYVETVTRKIANYLKEVLEDQRDKLAENLLANNSMSFSSQIFSFMIYDLYALFIHALDFL